MKKKSLSKFLFLVSSLLTIGILGSCDRVKESDLTGYWRLVADFRPTDYYRLNFQEDGKIELLDYFSFLQTGEFELSKNNQLIIRLSNNEKIVTDIRMLGPDSLIVFDSLRYLKVNPELDLEAGVPFELIGIKTDQTYKYIERKFFCIFSLFQSLEGETKVKIGEDFFSIGNLPLDLGRVTNCEIFIFIGKGVRLADLRELYLLLGAYDQEDVVLVLDKRNNDYFVMHDHIFVWSEELKKYLEEKNFAVKKPVRTGKLSKTEYLKNDYGKIINFDPSFPDDFLTKLEHEKDNILTIDCDTEFSIYVDLIMKMNKIITTPGKMMKTEIICK